MRRWTDEHVNVIRRFIEGRVPGPVLEEEWRNILHLLPGRTITAIKRKANDIRAENRRRGIEVPGGRVIAPIATQWTDEEDDRLKGAFRRQPGMTIVERVQGIAHQFEGRTIRALRARLRNKCPEVYYGAYVEVDEDVDGGVENGGDQNDQPVDDSVFGEADTDDLDAINNVSPVDSPRS